MENEITFNIYPSPTKDIVTIEFDNYKNNSNNIEIVLFDLVGKVHSLNNFTISKNQISLNVSDLVPGIYFIQMIIDGEKIVIGKVIIMK